MRTNFEQNRAGEAFETNDPYWIEKGQPKESFEVSAEYFKLDVYNFSEVNLSESQVNEIGRVVAEFAQIEGGVIFRRVKRILIDDQQPTDSEHPEGINGMGAENGDGSVKLYPRALKPISHRVKGVSNLEGTVIHEFTHALAEEDDVVKADWDKEFGWYISRKKMDAYNKSGIADKLRSTPRRDWAKLHPDIWKLVRVWENKTPEKCVTDYAKLGPDDDIADSMVAAMRNPEVLEPRRLALLRQVFLRNINNKNKFTVK